MLSKLSVPIPPYEDVITVSNLSTQLIKNKDSLTKMKLPELKHIARSNKLHVTGNKKILIDRIKLHIHKYLQILKIQSIFRGYITRRSFILRGPALKDRKQCVNESDFYTLEPLNDIPFEEFYSYRDNRNFVYGFNLLSIIQLIKNRGTIINPYNREQIELQRQIDIIKLYHFTHILFPSVIPNFMILSYPKQNIYSIITNNQNSIISFLNHQNISEEYNIRIQRYNNIIQKSISVRINELFMEIDLLGNYTQSYWFSQLTRREYIKLYRNLYEIWNYRANMSQEIRRNICPLYEPFYRIFNAPVYFNELDLETIKLACLIVVERMIYTGVDLEFRKLGALHALSALTTVSNEARESMPWLYESILI
jgi:hypothetical protein